MTSIQAGAFQPRMPAGWIFFKGRHRGCSGAAAPARPSPGGLNLGPVRAARRAFSLRAPFRKWTNFSNQIAWFWPRHHVEFSRQAGVLVNAGTVGDFKSDQGFPTSLGVWSIVRRHCLQCSCQVGVSLSFGGAGDSTTERFPTRPIFPCPNIPRSNPPPPFSLLTINHSSLSIYNHP